MPFETYQNTDLNIYNSQFYTNANQGITRSSGSYSISGTNNYRSIVIGNHPVDGSNDTAALDADIPIFLDGLTMTQFLTVKPVGPASDSGTYAYKTTLTVANASSVGTLEVEDYANLDIVLDQNLTVASISLGTGSTLTVTGLGTLAVTGAFTSQGTVALNGGTIDVGQGISAQTLTVSNAVVKANGNAISATDTISLNSGQVESASLFGYAGTSGEKELALTGTNNRFSGVAAVGCLPNSVDQVSITGIETISSVSNTTFYNDYTITYQNGTEKITGNASWPNAYRVSTSSNTFNGAGIVGYHASGTYKQESSVPLPKDYTQPGYVLEGWKIGDSNDAAHELSSYQGDVVLTAALKPGAVMVKLNLGFDPDVYTSDKDDTGNFPARITTIESQLNATVTLSTPFRFGYKFTGWKIANGTNPRTVQAGDYTIELGDCTTEGNQSVVSMEAQWEADKFNITLFLGSDVGGDENLEISVDGGTTYNSLNNFQVEGVKVSGRSITFSSDKPIEYGKNVSDYLRTSYFTQLPEGELPILRDKRTSEETKNFSGWSSASGAIDGTTTYCYGEGGMLAPGDKTLSAYQTELHQNNAPLSAVWGVMSYGLKLPNTMPAGWSLTYTGSDGAVKTIGENSQTDGTVLVQQDSPVTLMTSATNPKNFSLWDFKQGLDNGKIIPDEQPYTAGDSKLVYQFTMPAANVTATYNKDKEIWVDIAKSPIEFQEKVSYHNKDRAGFWYADHIDGMTPLFRDESKMLSGTKTDGTTALSIGAYFYQWNFTDKFCVTSNSVATKNQLTLVNTLTRGVYFKDVNLAMRDAYVNNAKGSLLNGVDCESSISIEQNKYTCDKVEEGLKNVDLADYANIVINNSTWQAYTTTFNFQGENNTVGAIMQDELRVSGNNINPLTLKSTGKDSGTVNLGTAFGNFDYTVSDITVTEYIKEDLTKSDFKYLFYCANQTGCKIKNAVIQAQHKNIHAGCMTDTAKEVSFTNSTADLYSICVFRTFKVINSYLRIRENARLGCIPIRLEQGAKVVIEGNLEMAYHHWADSDASEKDMEGATDDNPDNLLVVKGTFCDIPNRSWKAGTLICNNLVLGRAGGIKGGTVITNQITNQAVGFWKYDPNNHKYSYDPVGNNQTQRSQSNSDDYPFTIYHHKSEQPNTYTFSGGKIYLLGYYKTTSKTITGNDNPITAYDSTLTAMSENNPIAPFITPLFDANGDLVENPSVNTTNVEIAVRSSALTSNECVVLGNSNDYYSTRRSVEISGAEIYAAGNITFYNDTTVSGGTIYCNGSFGSKGDVTVTGGSITASVVGNAYNLKTTLKDKTIRWKRTDIQGGMVTADRIGAFEKRVSDTKVPDEKYQPKGTVTIGTNATIEGEPKIYHDVYINYIFNNTQFTNNGNKDSLRFTTTWSGDNAFATQNWSNTALSFSAPNVVGGGTGRWNWDSLNGDHPVDAISTDGIAQSTNAPLAENQKAFDRIQMKLYAVKSNYDLIFKEGASQVKGITCDDTSMMLPQTDGEKAPVPAGRNVVLTFMDSAMTQDKTVLWYIDAIGIIHSVNPTVSGNTISFTMPNSDVEVFVSDEVTLDLDIASYTLLEDGFRTEANATLERDDSTFHYLGSLVIHQGSIKEDIQYRDIDTVVDETKKLLASEQIIAPRNSKNAIIQTTNRILVDDAFDNSAGGRTVTLRRIYQNGTPTSRGIELEVGAKANFLVDGVIRTCRIYVPQGSDFGLKGKNNDRTKDAIYPTVNGDALRGDDWASIGSFKGQAGNITLQDLTILARSQGMLGSLCYSGQDSNNTVTYKNCVYKSAQNQDGDNNKNRGWYNRSYFAYRAGNVVFDGCQITLKVSKDWPGSFCDLSQNVTMQNGSRITVTDNGATETDPGRPFYLRIMNSLVIDNATLDLSLRVPDDGKTYRVYQTAWGFLPPEVKLTNNANLILEQHARLKKLVIGDSTKSDDRSAVQAGQTGTGYLLCEDIQVNSNASLEAGGIVVSGFYNGSGEFQTKDQFLNAMKKGERILDGNGNSGLVVNGGTVTAKEYITGDVNGKITVKGGTVSAPAIGTTGKLYGYTQYVPKANEEYIYTYKKIPTDATVTIEGGTVKVARPEGATEDGIVPYLGGMKTTVNISGGKVQLAEDAVLGLTNEQQTTLLNNATSHGQTPANFGSLTITGGIVEGVVSGEGDSQKGGSILMPYGTVNVSGADTAINVYDMVANCGNITIAGAIGKTYPNSYIGTDRFPGHENLGISIARRLSAQNLTIQNGSVVYAASAYANVPSGKEGSITVANIDNNRAYLYTTNAYGVIGEGAGSSSYTDTTNNPQKLPKNVYGTKVVDVHYYVRPQGSVLLDSDVNKVDNPNSASEGGLPYYTVTSGGTYSLQPASCSGYRFLGWYEYDPDMGKLGDDPVATISKENMRTVNLAAKWEKVQVTFEVQIQFANSDTATKEYDERTMQVVEGSENTYRFKEQATVAYGDKILGVDGVYLSNYMTKTLGVMEVAYNEKKVSAGDIVTADMADAFVGQNQANADSAVTPLILMVTKDGTQVVNILITLDQNKNNNNRPEDTQFNLSPGTVNNGGDDDNQVSAYIPVTSTLGNIGPFADSSTEDGLNDGLICPTAPGYTFRGWYTNSRLEGDPVTSATKISDLQSANTTTLYAKWTPNTYVVQFSAKSLGENSIPGGDNRWVTADITAPDANQGPKHELNYTWVYDTVPDKDNITLLGDGSEKIGTLPVAWREGYVFKGWFYHSKKENKDCEVTSESELDQLIIDALDVNKAYDGTNESSPTPALTLYASYRPVEVTYNLNGGVWASTEIVGDKDSPEYGQPLAGYSVDVPVGSEPTGYEKLGKVTSADSTKNYSVHSTTKDHFASTNTFDNTDYRYTLARKGYTFQGWKKAGEESVANAHYGCAPRFSDLSLVADWTPNTYSLKLHVKNDAYGTSYVSDFYNPNQSTVLIDGVTVGRPISASSTWPDKANWYAFNKGSEADTDNNKRFMLGATFAALDPGDSTNTTSESTYTKYAKAVVNMQNSKTMFSDGGTFFLPDDTKYSNDLADAVIANPTVSGSNPRFQVPDYPSGCTIPLYGVYRERSLVFIEEYVDGNGQTQSTIMHSCPWTQYSDYPQTYIKNKEGNYSSLTENNGGYALAGWYALSRTVDSGRAYPDNGNGFTNTVNQWLTNASITGTVDINVYTAYVAQDSISQDLDATANTFGEFSFPFASYVLPGSMQEGQLFYHVESKSEGLNLVDVADMDDHLYDSSWTTDGSKTYTANDTVALELKLEKTGLNSNLSPVSIVKDAGDQPAEVASQAIGKDWTLKLTLHHSKVMTETNRFPITIKYTFVKTENDTNILSSQWLKQNLTVKLQPSQYKVDYQVNLPEPEEDLKLIQPQSESKAFELLGAGESVGSGADAGAQVYRRIDTQKYGSDLLVANATLGLEGYDRAANWSYTPPGAPGAALSSLSLTQLTLGDLDPAARATELQDGKITVSAGYTPKKYALGKDTTVGDKWAITYGDGATDIDPSNDIHLNNGQSTVSYHSTVTFKPNPTTQPAEFITLTFGDPANNTIVETKRLDEYAQKKDGNYTFAMPARNVTISYNDVMELYLDEGSIELSPDGFTQAGKYESKVTWHGDYRILQCEGNNTDFHPTENTLKISGDMTTRVDNKVDSEGKSVGRTITLGNLNIESNNSIELIDAAQVTPEVTPGPTVVNLTQEGNIKAKNILVPSNTSLTLTGGYNASDASQNKTIKLAPESGRAAIGATEANPANGGITLDKVDVSMELNAPSSSSGIGSGNQAPAEGANSYGNVSITNSRIAVKESTSASSQYKGAWIGGAGVGNVSVTNMIVAEAEGSSNHNAKAIDGTSVSLENCTIGTTGRPVKEPIHAAETLNITGCNIYLQNESDLGDVSMIGTDGGTTTVSCIKTDPSKNSTIQVAYVNSGKTNKLFTGKLVIDNAKSDVTINGTQIVEVGNGNMAIEESKITQGGVSHDHGNLSLNYLLLKEKVSSATDPNSTPASLTVKSLGANKTITVQQPMEPTNSTGVTIGALTINSNAKVVLDGNLVVTEAASVAANCELVAESRPISGTGDAGCENGYGVTYQKGLSGEGSYAQTGGKLTGNADVIVKGNMTLAGVEANCASHAIGSNGGSAATTGTDGTVVPSTASTVTINGGNVTAVTIGACGAQNSTFTFVKTDGTPTIAGNLVQDHYRIAYDVGTLKLDLKDADGNSLPTVLRTQTDGAAEPVDPLNGIPANPTGDNKDKFNCWYISNGDGTTRLGLLDAEAVPSGLHGKTQLSANTASQDMSAADADGTKTLTVHAWVNPTGTALIKSGRVFTSFESGYTGKQVSVSQRGAWTAQLVSDGANVTGRDYQVTFSQSLPAGTDLTLTVLAAEKAESNTNAAPNAYYHYTVPVGGANTVKFSQFTEMGATAAAPPVLADRPIGTNETFLLSADFGELGSGVNPEASTVSFSLIPSAGAGSYTLGSSVNYTVTSVVFGAIGATSTDVKVNTAPAGDERLKGSKVYLVGTLSKTDASSFTVPLEATATLKSGGSQINGTWVNGNTVAFKLGDYGANALQKTYTFFFGGLPADSYHITWKLCAGDAPNVLNGTCSNVDQSSTYKATDAAQPSLSVACDAPRTYNALSGTDESYSVSFGCDTNASQVTVTVEKQKSPLATFETIETKVSPTISISNGKGTATAAIPATKGTYRVRFSIAGTSENDDVFYTFIVR
ncbi:InlB B-repeat-containing protein [Adlercreutzia sp. ZJ141]|uniref:InlB B-repeat-containing protein n=1 Tax=Adlercreutzia sp. ZJ141 TaxID=2709406 RepID=UPI0013EDFDB5|nr:InlB B-repeat-containing protein [Adlercreutzia sp. ZJ141]